MSEPRIIERGPRAPEKRPATIGRAMTAGERPSSAFARSATRPPRAAGSPPRSGQSTVRSSARAFFQRRVSDMDWRIVTPAVAALCEDGVPTCPDLPRPNLPQDTNETLRTTHFRNMFNPARLNTGGARSEMPK